MSDYNIKIFLETNLYIGSGYGFGRLIDHVTVKDSEGLAYIPASSIKGKLRSLCKSIALSLEGHSEFRNRDGGICGSLETQNACRYEEPDERCAICRLFGSPYAEGKLIFHDAKIDDTKAEEIRILSAVSRFRVDRQNELRSAVRISRPRRVSFPKHLFTIESVSRELAFTGVIHARDELTSDEEKLLKFGMKALTHLGGQKARGLGCIRGIICRELGLTSLGDEVNDQV